MNRHRFPGQWITSTHQLAKASHSIDALVFATGQGKIRCLW
jgi:hypothetical protein